MRSIHLVIGVLFINSFCYASSNDSIPIKEVSKYSLEFENALRIPTSFGSPLFITPEVVHLIGQQKIHHIDLVYTKNKENPGFDQKGLNDQRVSELKSALSQINRDQPDWSFIEQTGANSKQEAATYFHGFVIHYGDATNYEEQKEYFADYQKPFTSFEVDNAKGGDFTLASGSVIHVPAGAVLRDGNEVEGSYTINYREFRNQSEILFSGIPMDYTTEEESLPFESFGMYEMRGNQNGEELEVKNPIVVDFNCTSEGEGVNYYALNKDNSNWKEVQSIDFEDTDCHTKPKEYDWYWRGRKKEDYGIVYFDGGKKQLDEVENKIKSDGFWSTRDTPLKFDSEQNAVIVSNEDFDQFMGFLNESVNPGSSVEMETETSNATPTLIRGLQVSGFGVYNCDKVRRSNFMPIEPYYVDVSTGEPITCTRTTSVIYKRMNAVSTFHPDRFQFDSKRKSIILVFTNDHKVFACEDLNLKRSQKVNDTMIQIEMKEITSEVKTQGGIQKIFKL